MRRFDAKPVSVRTNEGFTTVCPILTTFVPRSREEESMIYTIIVVLIIVALVVFLMNRTRGRRGL